MNSIRCTGVMCFVFYTVFALNAAAQSPSEVLEKLKSFDSIFQAGGSVSGTITNVDVSSQVNPGSQGSLKVRQNWKLAFEPSRTGFLIETVDHDKPTYEPPPPPATSGGGRIPRWSDEGRFYTADDLMVYQFRSKNWGYWGDDVSGQHVIDLSMTISPEGETAVVGTMYNSMLFVANSAQHTKPKDTFLWSLGRFYSTLIHEVSSVERLPDGRIRVSAIGIKYGSAPGRWDLLIEPDAAWMVREARFYLDAQPDKIRFEMVNSGTTWSGPYCIPEEAICNYSGPIEGGLFPADELTFNPEIQEFDEELYAAAKHAVTTDRPPKLTIHDRRMSPMQTYQPDEAARSLELDAARENRLIARDVERAVEDVQFPEPGVNGAVYPVISSGVALEPAARPWYRLSRLWAGIILALSASIMAYAYFFVSKSR